MAEVIKKIDKVAALVSIDGKTYQVVTDKKTEDLIIELLTASSKSGTIRVHGDNIQSIVL